MSTLPTRPLGRTGFDVSLFALGGVTYNTLDDDDAATVVHRALDLGVNYIDTAHGYKESERKLGPVIAERRDEVFLATKSTARDADGMAAEIEESFRRLRTDRLDLVQIHDLHTLEQLTQITAQGGALETIERFRDEGRVRFIGVTGHRYPSVLAKALEVYPFDTILVALGAVHGAVRDFYQAIHPVAVRRGVGILGMKVMAYGFLKDHATDAMRYVLSLPDVSTAVIGVDDVAQVEANAKAAAEFQPLDDDEQKAVLATAREIYEQRRSDAWFVRFDGE